MSTKLPVGIRRSLRSDDVAVRAPAIHEVSRDEALLAALFADPTQLRPSKDRYTYGQAAYVSRVLLPCLAMAPALPPSAVKWAEAQTGIRWKVDDGPIDRIPFARLPKLQYLSLTGVDLGPTPPGHEGLETLDVSEGRLPEDLSVLARSFPNLRKLTLERVPISRVTGLAGLTRLTSLAMHRTPVRELSHLPPLASLTLHGCGLESLDAIALPPTLRHLDLSYNEGLRDVGPVGALDLEQLDVSGCASLSSVGAISSAVAVRAEGAALSAVPPAATKNGELTLSGLRALTSLESLDPSVRKLTLRSCDALASLRGLPEGLEQLSISGCRALQSLEGIERCTKLAAIDLYDIAIADLSPLAALPALVSVNAMYNRSIATIGALPASPSVRAITLARTQVSRKDVPKEHRWKCSWALQARVEEMLAQAPPAPAAELPKDAKKRLSALRAMLKSRDAASLDQAIELTATLADPAIYEALLERVSYAQFRRTRDYGEGYSLDGYPGPTGAYAMIGLLATAPAGIERAEALREQIASLNVLAQRANEGQAPVRPAHLARLPKLSRLVLSRVGPIRADETPDWPSLRSITLHDLRGVEHLGWLAGARGLERISIDEMGTTLPRLAASVREVSLFRANVRLDKLAGWPLETLRVGYASSVHPWDAIRELTSLTKLEGPRHAVAIAAALPALEELTIRGEVDLSPLAGHPSLRSLEIDGGPCTGLDALARIPRLASVRGAVPPEVRARYG